MLNLNLEDFLSFLDTDDEVKILKHLGLLPKSATETKSFLYKGKHSKGKAVECEVIGCKIGETLVHTVVIDLDSKNYPIHPAYLKDMQRKDFILY